MANAKEREARIGMPKDNAACEDVTIGSHPTLLSCGKLAQACLPLWDTASRILIGAPAGETQRVPDAISTISFRYWLSAKISIFCRSLGSPKAVTNMMTAGRTP
jgi:hypothetical protein